MTSCYAVGAANHELLVDLQRQLNRVAPLVIALPPTPLSLDGKIGDTTATRLLRVVQSIPQAVRGRFPNLVAILPLLPGRTPTNAEVTRSAPGLVADLRRVTVETLKVTPTAPPVVATTPPLPPVPLSPPLLPPPAITPPTTLPPATTKPATPGRLPPVQMTPTRSTTPWPFIALGAATVAAVGAFVLLWRRKDEAPVGDVAGDLEDALLDQYQAYKARPGTFSQRDLEILHRRLDLRASLATGARADMYRRRAEELEKRLRS